MSVKFLVDTGAAHLVLTEPLQPGTTRKKSPLDNLPGGGFETRHCDPLLLSHTRLPQPLLKQTYYKNYGQLYPLGRPLPILH